MEQFETWFSGEHPVDTCDYYASKEAWIAALKWAYQESLDNYDSSDFRFTLEQECPELAGDDMPWN